MWDGASAVADGSMTGVDVAVCGTVMILRVVGGYDKRAYGA